MPKVRELAPDDAEPLSMRVLTLADIEPATYNPRTMSDDMMERLCAGIREFGIVEPIVVNASGGAPYRIVGGHQRAEACRRLGIDEIPAIFVDLPKGGPKEKALNLALNKISGDWDKEKLEAILGDIAGKEIDIMLTGFGQDEVDKILGELSTGDTFGEGGGPGGPDTIPAKFCIIVDCDDEQQQTELLDRFSEEGLQCRALVS